MTAPERTKVFPSEGICLGIDPRVDGRELGLSGPSCTRQGRTKLFQETFEASLQAHIKVLDGLPDAYPLKPNLAYFLRFGSWGISRLEKFCESVRERFPLLLDGKFGEIATSLEAYLDFAFVHLGVQAVTLNPYMGEGVVRVGLAKCLEATSGRGRIYVLCATSEAGAPGERALGPLQDVLRVARACADLAREFQGEIPQGAPPPVGLVVGANRDDVLVHPELRQLGLPLLCPGLGAQGASFDSARRQLEGGFQPSLFPLSRHIFGGGLFSVEESLARLADVRDKLGYGDSGRSRPE